MPDYNDQKDYRSRLLAGLAVVLEQQSLAELYTGDIVREAKVSKRTFYEHFANKEACFLALYIENSGHILQMLRQAVEQTDVPMLERVQQGTHAYLKAMQAQAALMKRLYIDILSLGAEGMRARRQVIQQFADLIIALYAEEQSKVASLSPINTEMVIGLIAGLNELILFKIEDGEGDRLMELEETSRMMILGGIAMAAVN